MTRRERLRRITASAFSATALILFLAAPVFAGESGTPVEDTATGWVFRWINFLVVFGGVVYFFRKVAAPQLHGRAQGIEASIREAGEAREAASRELKAAEEKLAALPAEIAKLHDSAKRDTSAEAERLRTLLVTEVEKIKDAARAEVEGAERVMRLELKAEAGRMAVERAEALLHKRMTPEAQSSFMRQFVRNLTGVPR
jgi:F0F1-type ATP synthase membrane subunit b/b'